jgi:ADP-ribose pyrophosphatase YjhB (NUDIX family)
MALPDFPAGSDWTGAIIVHKHAVLLLKNLGHQGIYYVLPGGPAKGGETLDAACIRSALHAVRGAAHELGSQLQEQHGEDELTLSDIRKVANHPWSRTTYYYFLVAGNGKSLLSDRWANPTFDPTEHKFGVWMPYEWVSAERLLTLSVQPPEAVEICRKLLVDC